MRDARKVNDRATPQSSDRAPRATNLPTTPRSPVLKAGKTSPPDIDLDDLLTIEDVATKLKVKPRTVRQWKDDGKISFTRIDRQIYIVGEELREILRCNYKPALRKPPSKALREQGGDEEEKRGSEQ